MFTDEINISIKAGNGGSGCVSFRREKFIEYGGPDGGNGGNGGDVIIRVSGKLYDLSNFYYKRNIIAENGKSGASKKKHGKKGSDYIILIPKDTIVFTSNGILIKDFSLNKEDLIIAKGGIGGVGNYVFASSVNRSPRKRTLGKMTRKLNIHLVLKKVSDIGIIGKPNAGKSSLISAISNIKAEINNYAFTTLNPNIGTLHDGIRKFSIADIPGLIEGSSEGKGLGFKFLKHIEKCSILIHVLDAKVNDVVKDYLDTKKELEKYDAKLIQMREIIVLNKTDLITNQDELFEKMKTLHKETKKEVYALSAKNHLGIEEFKDIILKTLDVDQSN